MDDSKTGKSWCGTVELATEWGYCKAGELLFFVGHVVGIVFLGPSTVGTPGISRSAAHSVLVGPCHFSLLVALISVTI